MERHSEFPLFIQSAAVIVGFLLALSLLGWMLQPKGSVHATSTTPVQTSAIQ